VETIVRGTIEGGGEYHDSVDDYKNVFIVESLEAEVDTSWEEPDEKVEIEEVRRPGGGLMFRDGGD